MDFSLKSDEWGRKVRFRHTMIYILHPFNLYAMCKYVHI